MGLLTVQIHYYELRDLYGQIQGVFIGPGSDCCSSQDQMAALLGFLTNDIKTFKVN